MQIKCAIIAYDSSIEFERTFWFVITAKQRSLWTLIVTFLAMIGRSDPLLNLHVRKTLLWSFRSWSLHQTCRIFFRLSTFEGDLLAFWEKSFGTHAIWMNKVWRSVSVNFKRLLVQFLILFWLKSSLVYSRTLILFGLIVLVHLYLITSKNGRFWNLFPQFYNFGVICRIFWAKNVSWIFSFPPLLNFGVRESF